MHMEEKMGKKFFCCDAVLDTKSRQIAIFSGYAKEMQPISWEVADKRTYVHWAEKKYDVMVFGMPQFFHYADGMGTNPIMMMQALSAQVIRHKRIMKENCVIICSSICNGYFHDEKFTGYREVFEMFQKDYMNTLQIWSDMAKCLLPMRNISETTVLVMGPHPFHSFSMISCGHIAEMNTALFILLAHRIRDMRVPWD